LDQIEGGKAQWDYLKRRFEDVGLAYRMIVFTEWEELIYEGKDLKTFTNRYTELLRQLDAFDIGLKDEIKV
jgi:hypothetical protein